jgi:sec-independent protein translocase protein TatA
MGRIGLPELIVILIIVLVLFGASRIPEIMRSMGCGLKEFKNAIGERTENKSGRPGKDRQPPEV